CNSRLADETRTGHEILVDAGDGIARAEGATVASVGEAPQWYGGAVVSQPVMGQCGIEIDRMDAAQHQPPVNPRHPVEVVAVVLLGEHHADLGATADITGQPHD